VPRTGRPPRQFDWQFVETLATLGAQLTYVAENLLIRESRVIDKVSVATKMKMIERKIRKKFDCTYVEYVSQRQEYWRLKLKQRMRAAALNGNVTAMIFLSKQAEEKGGLAYSDKIEQSVTHAGEISAPAIDQEVLQKIHSDPEAKKLARALALRIATPGEEKKDGQDQ